MLILSRKADQRILVGEDIEIVVLAIDREHVKLGIVAPREVPVVRMELLSELRKENARAVETSRTATRTKKLVTALRDIRLRQPARVGATPRQSKSQAGRPHLVHAEQAPTLSGVVRSQIRGQVPEQRLKKTNTADKV